MISKKALLFAAIILVFVLGIFSLGQNKTNAIPIGPDKYFFTLDENETRKEKLQIYGRENLENTQKVYLYTVGMRKIGEEQDREFYIPDREKNSEVANWIKLSKSEVNLKKGEVVTVDWEITPSGVADCGTNLAAIVVASAPQDSTIDGTVVKFKSEVISQVHIDIKKANRRTCDNLFAKTNLVEFKVNNSSTLFDYRNVPFITRIENNGELIARSPKGFIEIYQGDKKLSEETIDFNPENLDIYPDTIRKFDNIWLDQNFPKEGNFFEQFSYEINHFYFGEYKAKLGVSKNANPQIISTVSFWIIPWRTISVLTVIIALLIIIFIVLKVIRKRKKQKQDVPQIIRLRDF